MQQHQEVDQDVLLARVLQEQERAFHSMLMAQIGSPVSKSQLLSAEGLSDEELARRLQEQEDEEDEQYGYDFGAEAEVDYDQLSYEAYGALGEVAGAVSKGLAPETLEQLPRLSATQHMQQQCSCRTQRSSSSSSSSSGGGVSTASDAAATQQAPPSCACVAGSMLCVVCQCEFEGSEVLKLLPSCGHVYHTECIDQWLASSKNCPVCHTEVALTKGGDKAGASASKAE